MVSELLNKYIWLVQTFVDAGDRGLDLEETVSKWELRWGSRYSRRSFCNHRQAIAEIFGVDIVCDRTTNMYMIRRGDELADNNETSAWLINAFTVNNLLALGKERLSGRVAMEDIPSGQKHLTGIMEAMQENRVLQMRYLKYSSSETDSLHVHPYAVKEFEKRWYLVGWCEERKALRVYGLDRIQELSQMERAFHMPKNFDVGDLFANSFGIYLPDEKKPVKIVFRASGRESKYLRDLPIHPSQKETSPGEFRIRVIPTEDLILELCRLGNRIEVLKPEEVRMRVASEHRKAAALYGGMPEED